MFKKHNKLMKFTNSNNLLMFKIIIDTFYIIDKIVLNYKALARKLKLVTFSRNWEIKQVCTKDRHYGWQQEIFFITTRRTLQNAVLGKKYFKA